MALCELRIHSEALGMETTVNVIIPQRKKDEKKLRCLYLLHGFTGDQNSWIRQTSIERYANRYGICVVMPYGARSYYVNRSYGEQYYTYIAEELPEIIEGLFPVSDIREDNFIAGNSMGGYGAMKIAMAYPEKFSAVAALSCAADVKVMTERDPKKFEPIFGESLHVEEKHDLFAISRIANQNKQKPRVFMSVGTEDYLYQDNLKLKAHLESLGFDYTYQEAAGEHNWSYWDDHIQKALAWMYEG